jgi:hypothetical protein
MWIFFDKHGYGVSHPINIACGCSSIRMGMNWANLCSFLFTQTKQNKNQESNKDGA